MKETRLTFGILGGVLFSICLISVSTSQTFHSGGVGECSGCHSMHSPAAGGTSLLVSSDQSSTCLTCHEHAGDIGPSSYHVSTAPANMPLGTAPLQRTPGGDFAWLKKSYLFVVSGSTVREEGQSHGHNIVAADFDYIADTQNTTSPGGTFVSANLACTSCHDPHGKYRRLSTSTIVITGAPIIDSGSYKISSTPGYAEPPAANTALGVYRLLAGQGYSRGGITYIGVPAAKAPNNYNQTEAINQVRVAYGVATNNGHTHWGTWCRTCHDRMHSVGSYVHPVDQPMSSTVITTYDSYVKSGDLSGSHATSYNSLVPFFSNSGDYAALATLGNDNSINYPGPTEGDQISCLSCHRVHASAFPDMLRWQMGSTFIVFNGVYPGIDNGAPAELARGRTSAETRAGYYDRPPSQFATFQRVLCNKCHAKD